MCRSMADIRSTAAEIRRGKKRWKKEGKKLQGKNIMAPLLHRAAIITAKNNRVKRELKAGTVVVLLPRDAVLCPVSVCHLSVCHKSGFCQNS